MTLGGANIWINGVDVGHIKGDVTFACEREYVGFKPSGELGVVKNFRIREAFKVNCQAAEMKLSNIRMALGVTTSVSSSYRPTGLSGSLSFDTTASDKWDSLTFGGSETLDTFALKLEHSRPNGDKIVICLYRAQCISNLDLAFREEDVSMQTLEFSALTDSGRSEGDKVGVMYVQTT